METLFIIAAVAVILILNLVAFVLIQNRRTDKKLKEYLKRTQNND